MRIFLSSTFEDLRTHRAAVVKQLDRMTADHAGMEYFPATAETPLANSLAQLKKCDVYVGLIGFRFGSQAPGTPMSMTQREYEAARELADNGKMELLIYLAADNFRLPNTLIQPDSLRSNQMEFRRHLQASHSCRTFSDETDLVLCLATDLYLQAQRQLIGKFGHVPHIFDEDDWPTIRDRFDSSADDRISRVQEYFFGSWLIASRTCSSWISRIIIHCSGEQRRRSQVSYRESR